MKFLVALSLCCALSCPALSQANVTTYHNDNGRTGQYLTEWQLTPTSVNPSHFGRLFSQAVDGYIYAQPLYVAKVSIGGVLHNVVYVATEHDSVYAFDARSKVAPLWHRTLINPSAGVTTVSSSSIACTDITPEVGITGTPVIDTTTGTLYVVAKTNNKGTITQTLHALNIATGADRVPPIIIQARVSGTGDGSSGGIITFDPLKASQRPALLLLNGTIFIAWASHCDIRPYHGWLMAFNASTLARVGVYNTTANGSDGGIWMSGSGVAADGAGNLFVGVGNGTFDSQLSWPVNVADSILRMTFNATTGTFSVNDYFARYNEISVNNYDEDLGSGGIILLPDQYNAQTGTYRHELIEGSKDNYFYLVNRDNMGRYNYQTNHVFGSWWTPYQIFGMPAYWNHSIYTWSPKDVLKAFALTNGLVPSSATARGNIMVNFPGTIPAISGNSNTGGIVWALRADAYASSGSAVLYAYNATPQSGSLTELYDSNRYATDNPGPAVKFSVPTIANGHVYVGTANQLSIFGLLPAPR